MLKKFLEAGKIVNTHGIRGEVKIEPWADDAGFLTRFKKFYINSSPIAVKASRVQNGTLIASLDGVDDIDKAIALKNKIISIDRDDARLENGVHFIQDIIGLPVIDFDSGETVGKIKDIYDLPAQRIYVVDCGSEVLVPGNKEFIKEVNVDSGYVKIHFIEGMR